MNPGTTREILQAVLNFERHKAEMAAAFDAMPVGCRNGCGTWEWEHANKLHDAAQIFLWNLLEDNTAALVRGYAYVKEPNMRISRHRLIDTTSIDLDPETMGEDA